MVAYSFKRRFVPNIQVGLGLKPAALISVHDGALAFVDYWAEKAPEVEPMPFPKSKRQTIRVIGKKRHARPGETVQLYCGLRTQHCFKIADAKCSSADQIRMQIAADRPWIWMKIANDVSGPVTDDFARADGFASVEEMWKLWRKEHPDTPDFRGVLIRWEPLQVQR